jgi:hypothetical protein
MSGTIGPADYGMYGSLIANASSVKQKLDTLTSQASSGLIGDTYAGLGSGAAVSLDLRPQMADLQTMVDISVSMFTPLCVDSLLISVVCTACCVVSWLVALALSCACEASMVEASCCSVTGDA